jgi:hypothetical protein
MNNIIQEIAIMKKLVFYLYMSNLNFLGS